MEWRSIPFVAMVLSLCVAVPSQYEYVNDPTFQLSTPENITFAYPRNITDVYKGGWKLENVSGSLPSLSSLSFDAHFGHFIIQLINKPSAIPEIDTIQGELVLRNGIYSTDNFQRYSLQGLYQFSSGKALLVANPYSDPVVENFEMQITGNKSMETSFEEANNKILTQLKDDNSSCYFTLSLRWTAVPLGFNEQHHERYEEGFRPSEKDPKPTLEIEGDMISDNCEIPLSLTAASLHFGPYYAKAVNYVVLFTLSTFLELAFVARQMDYSSTQSGSVKVSLLMIGAEGMIDSYLCLLHLTAAVIIASDSIFNAFAAAAFFKFVAFSIFEMKFLLSVWRSRQRGQGSGREFGMLYAKFYVFLFLGFVVMYYLGAVFKVFLFILYSFYVPQIICNATRDSQNALLPQYIIGMAFTRMLLPAYFFGCPENFLHVEPDPLFVQILLSWMIFQVGILFLQDSFGARFFIPKSFLPPKYNYHHRVTHLEEGEIPECVICMNQVELAQVDYMVTPCNHVFHRLCLEQWMEQKMECPTCRGVLPSP